MRVRDRLTPRQTQVCELSIKGLSSDEIAVAMGISLMTVRAHQQSVRIRLHAHTWTHAMVTYMQNPRVIEPRYARKAPTT